MPAAQNVKTEHSRESRVSKVKPAAKLQRTTFRISREMDFFSQKELITQTGHDISEWPFVIVKELVDNALDACDEADIPPVINVIADTTGITVSDNGPGLPEQTLTSALDFTIRASNREAYVAPDRGAQGNALKTLVPMPVVLDSEQGRLIITAHEKQHNIRCGVDPISQRAVIQDDVTELTTSGTTVRIQWGPQADQEGDTLWPFDNLDPQWRETWKLSFADLFRNLIEGFALFNPHACIHLNWFGADIRWEATCPAWKKWKPHQPTSSHWYEVSHLERLIGAYLTHDREAGQDRLVSDLVAEFDGMTGSQKRSKVLNENDLQRVRLSEYIHDGQLDRERISMLLKSLQNNSRPVKSDRLGVLGEDHLRGRLLQMGIVPESFQYKRIASKTGLPYVIETAFGYLGESARDLRLIFQGVNWSAAIRNPFRSFGSTGEGLESVLADMRAGRGEPVVFVLHLAHPRVEYTDRGKSALVLGDFDQG